MSKFKIGDRVRLHEFNGGMVCEMAGYCGAETIVDEDCNSLTENFCLYKISRSDEVFIQK